MLPFVTAVTRAAGGRVAPVLVHNSDGGWVAPSGSGLLQTREIVRRLHEEHGRPVVLLGHSSGGWAALRCGGQDAVIGSVIDNLSTVLGSVAARDEQLSGLVVSLQEFVTGLAGDREVIFDSLATIDQLATTTSGFLEDARAPLTADIQALDDLSRNLGDTGDVVERFLQTVPAKLDLTTRTAINGSWFNFFLCRAGGTVTLPATPLGGAPAAQKFEFESGAEGCS